MRLPVAFAAVVAAAAQVRALNPCSDSRVGPTEAVQAVVADHAWAAGVLVAPGSSCNDTLAALRSQAPAWARLLEAEAVEEAPNTGASSVVPGWSLRTASAAAANEISVARNASFAAKLAPACMAGICSPAQALATDALAGSLRLRDEPGWNRVGPNSAPLRFPVDHLLRECCLGRRWRCWALRRAAA